jgi:hypothetical protein
MRGWKFGISEQCGTSHAACDPMHLTVAPYLHAHATTALCPESTHGRPSVEAAGCNVFRTGLAGSLAVETTGGFSTQRDHACTPLELDCSLTLAPWSPPRVNPTMSGRWRRTCGQQCSVCAQLAAVHLPPQPAAKFKPSQRWPHQAASSSQRALPAGTSASSRATITVASCAWRSCWIL